MIALLTYSLPYCILPLKLKIIKQLKIDLFSTNNNEHHHHSHCHHNEIDGLECLSVYAYLTLCLLFSHSQTSRVVCMDFDNF